MTYETREGSVDEGRPVQAFKIKGIFGTYRYTDGDDEVIIGGELYRPVTIERGNVNLSSITDSLKTVSIDVPQDAQLAKDYGSIDTPERFSVEVFRAHRGDDWSTDFKRVWSGVAYGYGYNGRHFSISTVAYPQLQLTYQVKQTKFQLKCNHSLFDGRCGLRQSNHRSQTSVTAVGNRSLTVQSSPWPSGDLVRGRVISLVSWESRAILANSGNVLTLDRNFLRMTAGDQVRLIRGCDKSFARCDAGFGNTDRFGGFPFKPQELNIIKDGVRDPTDPVR